LLGKDLEKNHETTPLRLCIKKVTVGKGVTQPVARQLELLDYNNGNGGVFMWSLPRNYLEDNWDDLHRDPASRRMRGKGKSQI
jgi:hypothetical protein